MSTSPPLASQPETAHGIEEPRRGLGAALSWGASFGLIHASAEILVHASAGVELALGDIALLAAVYSLVAAIATAGTWGVARLLLRKRDGLASDVRRFAFLLCAVGQLATFVVLLQLGEGTSSPLLATLGTAVAIVTVAMTITRPVTPARYAGAFFVVSAALSAIAQISKFVPGLVAPGAATTFVAVQLGIVAVAIAVAVWLSRSAAGGKSNWSIGTISSAAFVFCVVAWTLTLQLELDWLTPRRERIIGDAGATAKPNVVLIVFDTVRADHLDLFGYERPTMPRLAEWAKRDASFYQEIHSTSSWTLPSHASMFTGMYPHEHGLHHPFLEDDTPPGSVYPLRADIATLPEFLTDAGYSTAAIVANAGAIADRLESGFQHVERPAPLAKYSVWPYRLRLARGIPSVGAAFDRLVPEAFAEHFAAFGRWNPPYTRAASIRSRAERWIEGGSHEPFFLFLNFMDAHEPYVAPAEFRGAFTQDLQADWIGFPYARTRALYRGGPAFSDDELNFLKGSYDEELLGIDAEFYRLIEGLQRNGVYDNSLIIVTSDHGEAFLEHGYLRHARTLFEEEILVPLIVKLPAGYASDRAQIGNNFQFVDIFATVAEVVGEPLPATVPGDAWGRSRDSSLAELYCVSCMQRESQPEGRLPALRRELTAVVAGKTKLIRSTAEDEPLHFNLSDDPGEREPIPMSALDPEVAKLLEKVEVQRREQTYVGVDTEKESPELLERLRGLGYLN